MNKLWFENTWDAQGQNVAAYEAEIGAIATRLYNLTDAERQIIEGRGE